MPRRLRSRLAWLAVLVALPLLIAFAVTGNATVRSHHVEYWFTAAPNDTTGELKIAHTAEPGRTAELTVPSFAADWHTAITTPPGRTTLRLSVTAATDLPADLRIRCWIAVDGKEVATDTGLPCETSWVQA